MNKNVRVNQVSEDWTVIFFQSVLSKLINEFLKGIANRSHRQQAIHLEKLAVGS